MISDSISYFSLTIAFIFKISSPPNLSSIACLSQLQQSLSALSGFGDFENIEDCRSRLESVKYEVEDIIETLDDIKSNTEFDEREFDRLDSHLFQHQFRQI